MYNRGKRLLYLYVIKGNNRDASPELVRKCLKDYAADKAIDLPDEISIIYAQNGKPYFPDIEQIHFSVSHSGDYWACVFERIPVGFDIEDLNTKKNRFRLQDRIAKRYFTQEEYDYISKNKGDSFFEIWVRKEAYLKYKGTGIKEGLSSFNLVKEGKLLSELEDTFIESFKIYPELLGAYCANDRLVLEKVVEYECN